jgi:hypothetical protein
MPVPVDRSLRLPESQYFPDPTREVRHGAGPHRVRRRAHYARHLPRPELRNLQLTIA